MSGDINSTSNAAASEAFKYPIVFEVEDIVAIDVEPVGVPSDVDDGIEENNAHEGHDDNDERAGKDEGTLVISLEFVFSANVLHVVVKRTTDDVIAAVVVRPRRVPI